MRKSAIVPVESIEQRILVIREQKVILDADLAQLYQVKTKVLNQAVKRNVEKFPRDFVFQLTRAEINTLMTRLTRQKLTSTMRSQIVTASKRNTRYFPYVFTEHGAIMAANVLKSERATRMSVYVVRAFVKLRETLATQKKLAQKLSELERKVGRHDGDINAIVEAIRRLMAPPETPKRQIGFRVEETPAHYRENKTSHSGH